MEDRREIINKFIAEAKDIFGANLVRTVLYGSYARGDFRENSDVDLMFLTTSSDEEIREQENRLYDLAFDYEMDYGVDISVIVKSRDHFEYWLGVLPFYDSIEREGVVLHG